MAAEWGGVEREGPRRRILFRGAPFCVCQILWKGKRRRENHDSVPSCGDVAFAEAVESHRVAVEHFPFEIVTQVFARFEGWQVAAELIALMRGIVNG